MDFLKEALKSQTEHKPNHTTTTNSDNAGEHKPNQTTTTTTISDYAAEHKQPEHYQSQTMQHRQPSTSELMESAKVVAEAAKAKMGKTNEQVDNRKVADAAGDLLCGVKQYAKLEENVGLGKYVGQAETYLHKYGSSGSSGGGPTVGGVAEENMKKEDDGHGHGGAGDYFKMAEGFLKK